MQNLNVLKYCARAKPLLCNDSEIGGYTRAVSGQQVGKHIQQNRHERNNRRAVFLCGPCRDVICKGQSQDSEFCAVGCEERT
jgi:hypothetical protein